MGQIAIPVSGGGTETLLWTNSSPNSSFSEQTISLNIDLKQYKFIKVDYFKVLPTDTNVYSIYMPNENIVDRREVGFASRAYNNGIYLRDFYVASTYNQITFRPCMGLNGSMTNNSLCIPLHIYGVN
jgi:hypothetical protein